MRDGVLHEHYRCTSMQLLTPPRRRGQLSKKLRHAKQEYPPSFVCRVYNFPFFLANDVKPTAEPI